MRVLERWRRATRWGKWGRLTGVVWERREALGRGGEGGAGGEREGASLGRVRSSGELSEGPLWERPLWGGGDLLEVKRRLLGAGRRGGRDGWGGLFKVETSGSRETMKIPGSSPHGMYAA